MAKRAPRKTIHLDDQDDDGESGRGLCGFYDKSVPGEELTIDIDSVTCRVCLSGDDKRTRRMLRDISR